MIQTTFIEDLTSYEGFKSGVSYPLTLKYRFSLAFRERAD